ncbi:MAG: glycoside hydrolase family protein [Motiliproteus sp.]
MNRDKLKQSINQHEGCIHHMYLDTRGNVTIAVGQLVSSATDAVKLSLVVRETQQQATDEQITAEYDRMLQQQPGKIAAAYKAVTQLEMTHQRVDELLDQRIDEFTTGIKGQLNDFDSYPEPAQEALLDMAFNLGVAGLRRKFPTMMGAAARKDWQTCAAECSRRGISDHRNQATQALFQAAESGS